MRSRAMRAVASAWPARSSAGSGRPAAGAAAGPPAAAGAGGCTRTKVVNATLRLRRPPCKALHSLNEQINLRTFGTHRSR